jgi:hypothetical protein
MEINEKSIDCGHSHEKYQKYIELKFPKDDPILVQAKKRGVDMADKVNINDPSGNPRTLDERIAANCRGALTEIITKILLENSINEKEIQATLTESTEMINTIEGVTQIDLQINIHDNQYEIETRSSCVRNGTEFGITQGFFNIIGWYSTVSKPGETKKDFYAMYLFPFDAPETMSKFDNGITVHFVGGATKGMLQGPLGSDETFRQNGAKYRGINPICAGLDANGFIDNILQ